MCSTLLYSRLDSVSDALSHRNVIWAADTNYRISFANDEVRRLAAEDDYAALMAGDQVGPAPAAFESGPDGLLCSSRSVCERGMFSRALPRALSSSRRLISEFARSALCGVTLTFLARTGTITAPRIMILRRSSASQHGPVSRLLARLVTGLTLSCPQIASCTLETTYVLSLSSMRLRLMSFSSQLDLSRYYRAELLASDHRPVYAVLRARIRTIDHGTRAALRKEILKDILVHSPAKKFDVKLSRITNGVAAIDLPPPSNDEQAWWKDSSAYNVYLDHAPTEEATADHPHGLVNLNELPTSSLSTINPFNAPHPRSSSQLSSHRKPPPIVPSKSSLSTAPSSRRKPPPPAPRITISLQPPEVSWTGRAAPPISQRPKVSRSPSASSLLDSDEDSRESKGRKGAGGWEVIPASQH